MTRFRILVTHGEGHSTFNVVDSAAPSDEQPCVLHGTRDYDEARRIFEHLNAQEVQLNALARSCVAMGIHAVNMVTKQRVHIDTAQLGSLTRVDTLLTRLPSSRNSKDTCWLVARVHRFRVGRSMQDAADQMLSWARLNGVPLRGIVMVCGDVVGVVKERSYDDLPLPLPPKRQPPKNFDEALEHWHVGFTSPLQDKVPELASWYHVSNADGIVAYFATERDALRYRLARINLDLNGDGD